MSEHNGSKYAPVPGKIPGRLVNMSGVDLVFAPLTLDQVQAFEETLATPTNGMKLRESMEFMLPVLLASLQRNYEDMTAEQLRPLLDVANMKEAGEALMDISGYTRTLPGEARPASP